MSIRRIWILLGGLLPFLSFAQSPEKRQPYDISKEKVLYTIGYSHLDTEWNWDYPTTINTSIKNIMTENFHLLDKYPDYVYNFTGSRRYRMMKEYYPELYKRIAPYVQQGRWCISGSSVDEAEVNISSSESLVRHVLYGNDFFRKEFGKVSQDYMLPDCFGFLANTPSIWHHCGLLGFSTQKLTWHSAVGIPFNVGIWNGPDGKGIIAALNATSYNGGVMPRLDRDSAWVKRFEEDQAKYGISFDYRYYGVGDEGGGPREKDVKNAIGSLRNNDSKLKVILTSSDQMFKDITPELRKKLPVYSGDLLLIEHSAGSLTSQTFMKRINRKNELLAKAAEQLATMADRTGAAYPKEKLNNAWDLVLGSQDHDILPGTASPKAFEYAWNDEFIAANGFAEVLKHSVQRLSGQLNTQVKGRSLVVYNPVALNREDVVTAELTFPSSPDNIQVYNEKNNALPTQIIERQGDKVKFIFLAAVPSVGLAVFDVRETPKIPSTGTLMVTDRSLENTYYKVTFDDKGDITSILDKNAGKELLSAPARLEFLHEAPTDWPAWNMDWKDRQKPPVGYMDETPVIRIAEQGNVRVTLEISRNGRHSGITQLVSLSAGTSGRRVEIANKIDWRSTGVSLKASFPLTVSNRMATYNLGVGTIQRANNDSVKYEVPAKEWLDLTDQSGQYGVTILEDCKYGSDKPADNELRLTLMYTPEANRSFRYQNTQDWGRHEFRYGIYGHRDGWEKAQSAWQGERFNAPMTAFEVPKHGGSTKTLSFLSIDNPAVGVMAMKKMETGNYAVIRVNELSGKDQQGVSITFAGNIEDAYEVDGQEQKVGPASFSKNQLQFDLSHYTLRSFAVRFAPPKVLPAAITQRPVLLPFNQDVMSYDDNRDDGNFFRRVSIPAELMPDTITSEDIHFAIGSRADGENNAVSCKGQTIDLPAGHYTHLWLLAAAGNDTRADFTVDDKAWPLQIQQWTGYVGQFYTRKFALDGVTVTSIDSAFSKQANIAWFASHCHQAYPSMNRAYQYSYLYKYSIPLTPGAKSITLPRNEQIRVLAITVADDGDGPVTPLSSLYDDFKDNKTFGPAQTPFLQKKGTATQLMVDGKPFLVLGGELHNSTSSSLAYMAPVLARFSAGHLNTALVSVCWDQVEPTEGAFDFSLVDGAVLQARQNHLRLILLWFGTWKNGVSTYPPLWVKKDLKRFPRAENKAGRSLDIISTFSDAALNADARAFAALMKHIREIDGEDHTVLMIQVENEVGVLSEARDRSSVANEAFRRSVPKELMDHLKKNKSALSPGLIKKWEAAGSKTSGNWEEIFGAGESADEIFSAWNYARFVGKVAEAGKAAYPLPMFVNTWLADWTEASPMKPGDYPSGGPLPYMMDIWKAGAPKIDILTPDIYSNFEERTALYTRPDNPLFIPELVRETRTCSALFLALGQHDAIGFSPFGMESLPGFSEELGKAYEVLGKIAPVILQNQGKGVIGGALLDKDHPTQTLTVGDYTLELGIARHYSFPTPEYPAGIFIQTGPDEYLVAGRGLTITFATRTPGDTTVRVALAEDGTFRDGHWAADRRLNGDEILSGKGLRLRGDYYMIQRVKLYKFR